MEDPTDLQEALDRQCDVLTLAYAQCHLGSERVRWYIRSGRWQRPRAGVVVAHSGPLTSRQRLWADLLSAGKGAALAGLTAALLDGLRGFTCASTHILVPHGRRPRAQVGRVIHRSTLLGPEHVHPARLPQRTRLPRSLVDAAAWAGNDDRARAILAAGVQQRLVRACDLRDAVESRTKVHRRPLIMHTIDDIEGGAHALSEINFAHLLRRYGLPEPTRQVMRRDKDGRRRWLDVFFEEWGLVVEVDGCWHMEAQTWWADMLRDNEITLEGHRVLRFPAFAVREQPELVARQITQALHAAGWRA